MSKQKKFPKIKKEIKDFLRNEEGKMTKEEIVNLGTAITAISFFVSGNISPESTSHIEGQEVEGDLFASLADLQLADHNSFFDSGEDCHSSHSQHISHSSCHTQHSSCHSQHSNHSSCHSQHSNHSSCHTQHSSCHHSHDSGSHWNCSHGSCHSAHSSHNSGGCPFIIIWNGKEYVLENNILPQSETSKKKDSIVTDLYKLENTPAIEDGFLKIRVVEFEKEKSFFESFELIKVTHPKEINLGVIDDEIVAYADLKKPSNIFTNGEKRIGKDLIKRKEGENVLMEFYENDNNLLVNKSSLRAGRKRIDKVEKLLKNKKFDSISDFSKKSLALLSFMGSATPNGPLLAQTHRMKSIYYYLQIVSDKKKETEVGVTHPRENMSTNLLDLSPYVNGSSISIRMNWTNTHNLLPIGIAKKTSIDDLKIENIKPEKIRHSDYDIKKEKKLTLDPGESLTIYFPETKNNILTDSNISYFIKSKGYYYGI